MKEDGFRFSLDKRFRKVRFEEFEGVAIKLFDVVLQTLGRMDVSVITAEDHETYNYTTTTFWSDEIEEALKKRKQYTWDQFTREVWDRSYDVQVDFQFGRSWISLSCDKHAEDRRMFFYAQSLDERTRSEILKRFRKRSLWYDVGDGMHKISTFNMIMGMKLTGWSLPR